MVELAPYCIMPQKCRKRPFFVFLMGHDELENYVDEDQKVICDDIKSASNQLYRFEIFQISKMAFAACDIARINGKSLPLVISRHEAKQLL